jgi:antagonist of KipI
LISGHPKIINMLTILKAGMLDTLQDTGRYGHGAAGINPGGVMDPFAAAAANFLAGNERDAAVLEMHFPGPQVMFGQDMLVSLCGGDFTATLDEMPIPLWKPLAVRKNTVLQFMKWNWGARVYLAVHGGFKSSAWLGSAGTNLKAGVGGHHGRALLKGDVLQAGAASVNASALLRSGYEFTSLPWSIPHTAVYNGDGYLLMLPGPEWDWLDYASQKQIIHSAFILDPASDRMACRLRGNTLRTKHAEELVSSGVDAGTVQLLPDGQLLVLAADHQTTGGYPRIGNIIGAHLPKLAQLAPNQSLQLKLTDLPTAIQMLFSQEHDLRILRRSCFDHLNQLHAYRS